MRPGGTMRTGTLFAVALLMACGSRAAPPPTSPAPLPSAATEASETREPSASMLSATAPVSNGAVCGGDPLRVTFYNAGQGLAALVTLPTGEHILVDTGESSKRAGCGAPCKGWHSHVMQRLAEDLGSEP